MTRAGQPGHGNKGKTWRHDKTLQRDVRILAESMPRALGGEGLTAEQIAEKHQITRRNVYHRLARPDIKQLHEQWLQSMFDAHRRMGPTAIAATQILLEKADPYTVAQYWKRMGVTLEPVVNLEIEELRIEAPKEILDLVKTLTVEPEGKNVE